MRYYREEEYVRLYQVNSGGGQQRGCAEVLKAAPGHAGAEEEKRGRCNRDC